MTEVPTRQTGRHLDREERIVPAPQGSLHVLLLRRVGGALQQLRQKSGLSSGAAAKELGWSQAKLSTIENGRVKIAVGDVARALDLYDVKGERRVEILDLAEKSRVPGWWSEYASWLPEGLETYIGWESAAASLRVYDATIVNGLLQTPDYARAVIQATRPDADEATIQKLVEVRLTRQQHLSRPDPLRLWMVVEEEILRRPVGGPELMRQQLAFLQEAAARPNITVQVLSTSRGVHAGLHGSFSIIEFPGTGDADVAYVDSAAGNVYIEKPAEVRQYTLRFDHLRADALPPAESAELIAIAANETEKK